MAHLLTTIPKSKFRTWKEARARLIQCNGDRIYWLINTATLPKQDLKDKVCFMTFDGIVRGYLHIVDSDLSENWRTRHGIGKARTTHCIVMCNWVDIAEPVEQKGFQGWRYTHLQP